MQSHTRTSYQLGIAVAALCCSASLLQANITLPLQHGVDPYVNAGVSPGTSYTSDAMLRTVSLNGSNKRRSEWIGMSASNYAVQNFGGGFGGGAWKYAMSPNTTFHDSISARLYKGTLNNLSESNAYGNPGGVGGLYAGMGQVSYTLLEVDPVADLHTVVFQAYLTSGSAPWPSTPEDVYGVDGDFVSSGTPTLTLIFDDGSTMELATNQSEAELYESRAGTFSHTGGGFEFDIDIFENYRSYRWNLGDLGVLGGDLGNIVGFAIQFMVEPHVALRSLSLDQAGGMIPEPSTYALLLSAVIGGCLISRRRKKATA